MNPDASLFLSIKMCILLASRVRTSTTMRMSAVPLVRNPVMMLLPLVPLLFSLLFILPSPLSGQAEFRGDVVDIEVGTSVAGVEIHVADSAGIAVASSYTDRLGTFEVGVPGRGIYRLRASRSGYQPVEGWVEVSSDSSLVGLTVRMAPGVIPLNPILVVARGERAWGSVRRFRERVAWIQQYGGGRVYLGEQLRSLGFGTVDQVIDSRPWGGGCRPTIFINGIRTDGDLFGLSIEQILGIELYRVGERLPPEYFSSDVCAAALVWTRNESPDRGWSWRRIGAAALIVGVIGTLMR